MALKAILDSIDGLPDPIKAEYTQKDGKFVLSVEAVDGWELDDVAGLKNGLSSERGITTAMKKELEKLGSKWDDTAKKWVHIADPVKIKQAVAKFDEFSAFDPTKEADKIAEAKVQSIKEQLVAEHEQVVNSLTEKNGKLNKGIEKVLQEQVARAEIIALKGVPELVLPAIKAVTRVVEKDDDFVVEVLDDKGNVRIGDSKGTPMTVKQLVAELRGTETYGRAFEGDGKQGSGKQPGSGGGTATLKRSLMTAEQKKAYQDEHGAQAFLKLPLK